MTKLQLTIWSVGKGGRFEVAIVSEWIGNTWVGWYCKVLFDWIVETLRWYGVNKPPLHPLFPFSASQHSHYEKLTRPVRTACDPLDHVPVKVVVFPISWKFDCARAIGKSIVERITSIRRVYEDMLWWNFLFCTLRLCVVSGVYDVEAAAEGRLSRNDTISRTLYEMMQRRGKKKKKAPIRSNS